MVNSRDVEMIDRAADLLRAALNDGAWRPEAQQWLGDYDAQYAQADATAAAQEMSGPIGTRWRPIDNRAQVAKDPAPEPPDEPDEGETGPDQVDA